MIQSLEHDTDPEDEAETVSSALQMALTVRLRIFAVEKVEPAATGFLSEFSERLDRVRARRHTVDFEAAKAWAWWKGEGTDELIELGHETLAADSEIQRLKRAENIEAIIFNRYAENVLRNLISERFDYIELQMQSLRNNRLNVQ
jgi:hypothetical protein